MPEKIYKVNRDDLEKFLPNPRTVKEFEKLFSTVPDSFDSLNSQISDLFKLVYSLLQKPLNFEITMSNISNFFEDQPGEYDIINYSNGEYSLTAVPKVDDLVINNTSEHGIKVDKENPVFTWVDLLGEPSNRSTAGPGGGIAIPDFVQYIGSIYAWRFGTIAPNNHLHERYYEFHMQHDYVPGTDLYLHVHWSQNIVGTGNSKWYFDVTISKSDSIDPFVVPKTFSVISSSVPTQYAATVGEVQITNSDGSGGLFNNNKIVPASQILVRVYRDPNDPSDTLTQDAFLHHCDIHYLSRGIGTKTRFYDFYS